MATDYKGLLEITRLSLSSPEHVYAYLESKAEEGLPPGVSTALFKLDHRLIKLGLARFSDDREILRTLFGTSEDTETLRCAVLANPHCDLSSSYPMFGTLEDDALKAVLETGTDSELQAMLSNKSLKDSTLAEILTREGWAQGLSDDRWLSCAILALESNPNLRREYKSHFPVGYSTGWEFSQHNRALYAAWGVLELAPLTESAAGNLSEVFSMRAMASICEDAFFLRVFGRWRSEDPSLEKKFSDLRMWVGSNVPALSKLHEWMASHEDPSIRQGHYFSFDTYEPDELDRYFERDGDQFISAAIINDNLYREENVRTRLRQLVDKNCHTRSDWFDLDLFESRLERLAQQDPTYLREADRKERQATDPVTIGFLNHALEQSEQRMINYLGNMMSRLRRSIF